GAPGGGRPAGRGGGGREPLSRNRAEFESDRKVPLPMTSALREFTQGPGVSPSQAEQTLQRRSGMPVNISATAAQGSL
ncbi:hypothetical protein CWM95_09450, partial [Klebsiella pneumoniae]